MNTGITRSSAGLVASAFLAAAFVVQPASAQEDLADRVHELEQELQLLRLQLEAQVRDSKNAADAAAAAAEAASEAATSASGGDIVKMKGPAPTFSTEDGQFTMSVTGRVHWDMGLYDDDETSSDLNDGTNLRRARLGVKGKILKDWGYNIVLDGGGSAADDVAIDTAFITYKGIKPMTLTLGQHKAPLTLEDRTSSNDIPFIERSLSTNLFVGPAGGKRMGASATANGSHWWAGVGVFGEKLGVDDSNRVDEQWSLAGRLAFAPINTKGLGMHIGGSGWLIPEAVDTPDAPGRCRFRDRPEFRVDDSRWIDAKGRDNKRCYGVGAEFAGWYDPFWFASEVTRFGFDEKNAGEGDNVDFGAHYIQVGWVLTGEGRPYSMRKAAWSGVKPASPLTFGGPGLGAFELLGRYSHADLEHELVSGGEQTNYTLGLNWWLNNWIALKFNYIAAEVVDGGETDEFDIYGLRAQVKW